MNILKDLKILQGFFYFILSKVKLNLDKNTFMESI